jgi:hypothetical protein
MIMYAPWGRTVGYTYILPRVFCVARKMRRRGPHGDAAPLRPGLLASARTCRAEHPLHPTSFPARCGSGAGLTHRRRDVARGHADHRADAREKTLIE